VLEGRGVGAWLKKLTRLMSRYPIPFYIQHTQLDDTASDE